MIVILLGPPGSGKGTQADLLAEKFGLFHFGTSKIIQEKFKSDSEDPEINKAKKLYESGQLATPKLVTRWVKEAIEKLPLEKGIVFDGSPRTLGEAEVIFPFLEERYSRERIRVVNIKLSPQESVWRNTRRKICSHCRQPVPYTKETKNLEICPECGGKLVTRELDKPEIIKERLKVFKKETKPVIDFFRKKRILRQINGEQSIEDVSKDIASAVLSKN